MAEWSSRQSVRQKALDLWDRGLIVELLLAEGNLYCADPLLQAGPLRFELKGPTARDIKQDFPRAMAFTQRWMSQRELKVEYERISTRLMGQQLVPRAVVFEKITEFVSFIGKQQEFGQLRSALRELNQPLLLEYVRQRPRSYLKYQDCFGKLFSIAEYLMQHPRPQIYLRELSIAGIDTKFIEHHKGILGELLDFVLPAENIDNTVTGAAGFARRYGFLEKPARIRFRILDPALSFDCIRQPCPDVTLDQESFARLDLACENVIVCENEISFLALPRLEATLGIFGSGYGFAALKEAQWLKQKRIFYWGDLDTHGFAILREFRLALHPCKVESVLMDYDTLMKYQHLCVEEPRPRTETMLELSEAESLAYRALVENKLGPAWGLSHMRLEQELIPWQEVKRCLTAKLKLQDDL